MKNHLVKNLIFAPEKGKKTASRHRNACVANPAGDAVRTLPGASETPAPPLLSPAAVLRACVDRACPYLGVRGLEECRKGHRWM